MVNWLTCAGGFFDGVCVGREGGGGKFFLKVKTPGCQSRGSLHNSMYARCSRVFRKCNRRGLFYFVVMFRESQYR